jgi:hypothetical protein
MDDRMDDHPHPERDKATPLPDDTLPAELVPALDQHGIALRDEVGLRRELERHLTGFTLYRLTPAAARRWKCKYRIMFGATYFDCQTVPEAYARALLAALEGEAGGG